MRPALSLTALVGVALIAFPASASAAHHNTTVVIDGFSDHYFEPAKAPDAEDVFGRLESGTHKCVASRRVKVFRVDAGPDTNLGSDTSDSNGGWSLMIPNDEFDIGDYYAKTPKVRLRGGDTCNKDRSANLGYP